MKVIIINDKIINFNNVLYVKYGWYGKPGVVFLFHYNGGSLDNSNDFDNVHSFFRCSKEEYQKIYKKIIDFLKDKDETILELNINEK